MSLTGRLTITSEERFVDLTTDSSEVVRKLVVNIKTGKQRYVPTDTKRRFVDIVHGQMVFYNPVSGKRECEPCKRY